jgi:phage terminase large subunit
LGSRTSRALQRAAQKASPETQNPLREYAEDIKTFCVEVLGIYLYSRQLEIVEAILKHRRVFVKSGHSVGKTAVAAVIAEWVFSCLGDSVLTSAPSRDQVKQILWKQIETNRVAASKIGLKKLPGDLFRGTPELRVEGAPDWWAVGFFTDKPDRAAGRKHPRMFVILDEMSGIPRWFLEGIDSSMASDECRMLGIGNPIHPSGPFYEEFSERRDSNHCITISVTDSPNVSKEQAEEIWRLIQEISPRTADEIRPQIDQKVDEVIPLDENGESVYKGLCSYQWIIEKIQAWRDDVNSIRTRLLGLFASDESSKMVPLAYIEAANALWLELEEEEEHYEEPPNVHCAYLDCAAEGPDYSVLSYLRGQRIHVEWVTNEPDRMQTAQMVLEWLQSLDEDNKPAWIAMDVANVGGGVKNRLEELKREHPEAFGRCQIIGHHPGATPDDKKNFSSSPAELYWRLRESIRFDLDREERLALPPETHIPFIERRIKEFHNSKSTTRKPVCLTAELNARNYTYDNRERLVAETKPQLRKRKILSTDVADSVAGLMIRPKIVTIVS